MTTTGARHEELDGCRASQRVRDLQASHVVPQRVSRGMALRQQLRHTFRAAWDAKEDCYATKTSVQVRHQAAAPLYIISRRHQPLETAETLPSFG